MTPSLKTRRLGARLLSSTACLLDFEAQAYQVNFTSVLILASMPSAPLPLRICEKAGKRADVWRPFATTQAADMPATTRWRAAAVQRVYKEDWNGKEPAY
jgi:hypothetical protein